MSTVPASLLPTSVHTEGARSEPSSTNSSNHHRVRQSLAYRVRLPLTASCVLIGIGVATVSRPLIPPGSAAGMGILAAGLVLVLMGTALRLWALACISERKTKDLVTTGPYSLCRNPLYVGTLLIVAGFAALWLNPVLVLMLLPPIVLYCVGVVPAEERVLRQTFGVEYETYCRNTTRWMPGFTRYVGASLHWRSAGVLRESQSSLWWLGLAALSCWMTFVRESAAWLLF